MAEQAGLPHLVVRTQVPQDTTSRRPLAASTPQATRLEEEEEEEGARLVVGVRTSRPSQSPMAQTLRATTVLAQTATATEARQTRAEFPWESPPPIPGTVARGRDWEEVATAVLPQAGPHPLVRLQAAEGRAATVECPRPAEPRVGVAVGTAARATRWTAQAKEEVEVERRPTVPGVVPAEEGGPPRSPHQRALPTAPSLLPPRPPTRARLGGVAAAGRPSATPLPPHLPSATAPSSRPPAPGEEEEGAELTAEALPPLPRRGVPPLPPTLATATKRLAPTTELADIVASNSFALISQALLCILHT